MAARGLVAWWELEAVMNAVADEVDCPRFTSHHILIVEDNPDGRESLRILLQLLGHRVEVAADGVEGFEKALRSHPEVVLLDIGLPRLDGYEVARRLRVTLGHGILLLAHSAYGNPEDRLRALRAGFDGWIQKPLELHDLEQWLDALRADDPPD
jgi:two-component system CheB/CheR fusion protein